jgi:hypothetical protein
MDHHHHNGPVFAANAAGAFWWFVDQLCRYGPSWSLVPPLLIAVASVIGATTNALNARQARRLEREKHEVEVRRGQKRILYLGSPEELN